MVGKGDPPDPPPGEVREQEETPKESEPLSARAPTGGDTGESAETAAKSENEPTGAGNPESRGDPAPSRNGETQTADARDE